MFFFDIVSLALGITPLIIEFLKHNPEIIHTLQAVKTKNTRENMAEFYKNLEYEVAMLKLTLTQLIKELPIKKELKEKFTNENSLSPSVWLEADDDFKIALEKRLDPCSASFKHSMEKILTILSKLVDDKSLPIGQTRNHLVSFYQLSEEMDKAYKLQQIYNDVPYAKLEKFFNTQHKIAMRLKLGWKKDKRNKMMYSLQKHNKRLDEMLCRTSENGTNYAIPEQRPTAKSTLHAGLRQKMHELRKAIGQIWCKCTAGHELRFGLSKTWKDKESVRLDMIMNLSKDGKVHWGESKINIHLNEPVQSPSLSDQDSFHRISSGHRRSSTSLTGTTVTDDRDLSPTSKTSSRNASVSTSSTENPNGSKMPDAKSPFDTFGCNLVDDICEMLRRVHLKKAPLFSFISERLLHNATTLDRDFQHAHDGVTLRECLEEGYLTMKDRKLLQVLVAQSVLFFPWVGQKMNNKSITFHFDFEKRRLPFATLEPDYGGVEPYSQSDDGNNSNHFRVYNNDVLAALAALLLEIELKKPIEEMRMEEDSDEEGDELATNVWTVTRVLKEQRNNMYDGCYQAIDACLRCDFETIPQPLLSNENILTQVYEKIVAPLEQEFENGFKIRVPYLWEAAADDELALPKSMQVANNTPRISEKDQRNKNVAPEIPKRVRIARFSDSS